MWGWKSCYVIGRGNTATAYLQAGMIRPVPGATADAVVDVQVQRTGGESRLKNEEVVLFFLAEKRAERTCGEEKMATPGWTEKKRSSAPMRRGSVPQKIYWEGINLNKISKKIVSLVTAAAFATTLVPAAAFGATLGSTTTPGVADMTFDGSDTIVVKAAEETTFKVNVVPHNDDNNYVVWLENAAGDVVDATYTGANVKTDAGTAWENAAVLDGAKATVDDKNVITGTAVLAAGEYTIHGGYSSLTAGAGQYDSLLGGTNPMKDAKDVDTDIDTFNVLVANANVDPDDSALWIDRDTTGSATQNDPFEVEFAVLDNVGAPVGDGVENALNVNGGTVYIWAEYANGTIVSDADFSQIMKEDGKTPVYDIDGNPVTGEAGIFEVTGVVNYGDKLNVTIPKAADGIVIKSVVVPDGSNPTTPTVTTNNKVNFPANSATLDPVTVNVAEAATDITAMEFTSVTGADKPTATNTEKTVWYTEIKDDVTPSDTKDYTVKGKVTDKNNAGIANEELYVSCDDSNLKIQGEGTVTTNAAGEFSFNFNLLSDGKYTIKVTEADGTYVGTLIVKQGDVDAVDIAVVKDGGVVLAGTDKDYAKDVYGNGAAPLSDAVQFAITDAYGRDAMGPGPITDEAAANALAANHADSLEIKGDTPDTVNAKDFQLAWDEDAGVYTLEYVDGDGDGYAKDLVAGDYSIRVALNNGGKQAVTVNFTVAEFGDVEELVLDMSAAEKKWWDTTNQNNAITAIDDQVALGQWVKVEPKYVDANGLKVKANAAKMQVGINGDAVVARDVTGQTIGFATADNSAANNALVGSTITVKVNDASLGAIGYVEKELTVVKNYLAETVTMDPVQGVVGESNTATVSVVDENGNVSKVNGKLTATVVAQSDETADVDLKVNPQVKNGTARIYLESDKAGTADVRLVVEAANGELYADTITYTFGDEDPYAGSYVVMTIGASDYLINGSVVEGDGAPYVDDAWRTMVPFRVLGEAFGAEVEWNQEAQSVTYTVGETELVMTIGEDTYTLNGEEQTMDTAPVLSGDRTYVPVRFVAEDLGFEVTPLYDATTGATASVVFQK